MLLSNLWIFPAREKGSSAFETHLVLLQPGWIKELSVMTGRETWTPRFQGLPDEKNVVHGLGQFCLILYGKTPGMLQKCRNVEIRLAWMATRFPPTPMRTKQSKPVNHLYCSRKSSLKLNPRCVIHLQTLWEKQRVKGKVWSHLSWWCCAIHLAGTAFKKSRRLQWSSPYECFIGNIFPGFPAPAADATWLLKMMQLHLVLCSLWATPGESSAGNGSCRSQSPLGFTQPENHYCLKDNKHHGEWLYVCLKASDTLVKWEEIIREWIRAQIC